MSRKGKPVAYLWYAPDWLSDPRVQALTLEEKGAYRELLDLAWMDGGLLPAATGKLARMLGLTLQEFQPIWLSIHEFWVEEGDHLHNEKLDRVVAEQQTYRAEQTRKSRLAAEKRTRLAAERAESPADSPADSPAESPQPHPSTPTSTSEPVSNSTPEKTRAGARTSSRKKLWKSAGFKSKTFPEALQHVGLMHAWDAWLVHRREIQKPVTQSSGDLALKKLATMGPERAVASIEHTIAMGWQGLREPDGPSARRNGLPRTGRLNTADIARKAIQEAHDAR